MKTKIRRFFKYPSENLFPADKLIASYVKAVGQIHAQRDANAGGDNSFKIGDYGCIAIQLRIVNQVIVMGFRDAQCLHEFCGTVA